MNITVIGSGKDGVIVKPPLVCKESLDITQTFFYKVSIEGCQVRKPRR